MQLFSCKLVALVVLGVATNRLAAQPEVEPRDGKVTYAVTLTPTDTLKPISRAYLLPEYGESLTGNRVQMFLRCFMEQDHFFGQSESSRREGWNQLPLQDLPLSEVKHYGGRLVEKDMYDAARMTTVDWQLWHFIRRDGFNTLLPDVQKMRAIATVLKTRVRGEIAAGNFDGALRTFKTFLSLARTMESQPTLIGHLVGLAIASITADALQEFIQQPGSPNLYWALTDLPAPFLSLRSAMEGERMIVSGDFEPLKTAAEPVSDAAILKKIDSYEPILRENGASANPILRALTSPKASFIVRAASTEEVKAARARLIGSGLKPQHVNVWSPLHVVLVDDEVLYEKYRDEVGKWMNLPYWQAKPGIEEAVAELAKLRGKSPFKSAFVSLVPAMQKVKQAQARIDQRIAYLQILEAIRLYAYKNGGTLPSNLADTKLPLPVDPITGKPFEYAVQGEVATLHGANPHPGVDRLNRYYEIRIKK